MRIDQVALQLFTLRSHLRTPPEISATLKRVRAMGYQAVQASGLGTIADTELHAILHGEGLTLCATHEGSDRIVNEPEKVVDRLRTLECTYTAFPSANVNIEDPAQLERLAYKLDHAGEVLHKAGQVLTYHNHALELMRHGESTILDYLYDKTNADHLQAEIDTYWIQYGGGDPVEWCAKLKNRLPLLHIKDYQITAANKPDFAEIGYGNLNWKKIIAAAQESGCKWFIVEQDTTPGDPFESVKKSFDYISANLCS